MTALQPLALYSLVLNRLSYSYDIVETNYHIFLLVQTSKGDVMIETTDRFGGFVTDAAPLRYVLEITDQYTLPRTQLSASFSICSSSINAFLRQTFSGLLYFNQAVKAYNRQMLFEKLSAPGESKFELFFSPLRGAWRCVNAICYSKPHWMS